LETNEALRLNPQQTHAYRIKSLIFLHHKKYDEARECLNVALEIEPEELVNYVALCFAFYNEKKWKECVAVARKTLELNPEFAPAHNFLANALIGQDKNAEALPHLQQSLRIDPDNAWTHESMARYHLTEFRSNDSIPHSLEALRLDPNLTLAKRMLIMARYTPHLASKPPAKSSLPTSVENLIHCALFIAAIGILLLLDCFAVLLPSLSPWITRILPVCVLLVAVAVFARDLVLEIKKYTKWK
jgi:tetratricopeptide (TPR) repeat protein